MCITLILPELPKLRSESLLCRIGIGQDDERERVCGEDILVQYFNISIFMYIYLRRAHLELWLLLICCWFSSLAHLHLDKYHFPTDTKVLNIPIWLIFLQISHPVGVVQHLRSCPCSCSMCNLIFTKMKIFFSHWSSISIPNIGLMDFFCRYCSFGFLLLSSIQKY